MFENRPFPKTYLFKLHADHREVEIPEGFSIRSFHPGKTFHDKIWQLLSAFSSHRFTRWEMLNEKGEVVTYEHTIGKIFQFPFLGRKDIHFGPSFTPPEFRRKGYHKKLLNYIINQLPGRTIYAWVHYDNTPSINTLERLGFQRVGLIRFTRYTRRYVVTEWFDEA